MTLQEPVRLPRDAIAQIGGRRINCDTARPHSSIGKQTPATFAAASILTMERAETLRSPRDFVARPVAQTEPMGSNAEPTLPSTG
jgi:hypothetical protein